MAFGLVAVAGVSALVVGVRWVLARRKDGAMDCIHEENCVCYGAGYVAGKAKAHFELRHHVRANHAGGCGCEPCRTLRAIVVPVLMREAESARGGHVAHILKAAADHPEGTCDVCR